MPRNPITGTELSGHAYLRAKVRSDPDTGASWFPLIIRPVEHCPHGLLADWDEHPASICLRCAESWSWDHDLQFWRTAGGRKLANQLNLDPIDAGQVLRYRDGYEPRPAS